MILQFRDYKVYLREWMAQQPSKGHGETAKLAAHLNISASLVSTILNSDRHFSLEQVCELAEYLGLDGIELEYFNALISYERAGSVKLRDFWQQQRKRILKESEKLKSRVRTEKTLTSDELARYYSHALYSQVRVLSTLDGGISWVGLLELVKTPANELREIVDFLLEVGLLKGDDKAYRASDQILFMSRDSVHYLRHHMNWRLQQINQMAVNKQDGVTITFPCTLNREDFKKIQELLTEAVAKTHKIVKESPAEEMACLTIDFISYPTKP